MIVQQQMSRRAAARRGTRRQRRRGAGRRSRCATAGAEAMRLFRRLGANARYFTDQSTKIALDVASGDAAAGMCIDYYGRFQAEAAAAGGTPGSGRVRQRARRDVDQRRPDRAAARRAASRPRDRVHRVRAVRRRAEAVELPARRARRAGALRAAPAPDRRRTCTIPRSTPFRADPDENPYEEARDFVYHRAWTGPLYGAIAFVVRAMCVEPEPELQEAYAALDRRPASRPRRRRCSTTSRRSTTPTVAGPLRAALQSPIRWTRRAGRSGWSPASARSTGA